MIPALCCVPSPMSSLRFLFNEICETVIEFDIPTDILKKIDVRASYFKKTCIKGEKFARQQSYQSFPPAFWNHNDMKTQRQVSFELPMQLKAGITALCRFSRAATHPFVRSWRKLGSTLSTRTSIFWKQAATPPIKPVRSTRNLTKTKR